MSPEAAAGRAHEADARSDVYSLGVILYELICGKRPSEVPSEAPLWRSTRTATPPTPRSVDRAIPIELDRICMKAIAFHPEDRHRDAITLASALDQCLDHRRPSASSSKAGSRKRRLVLGLGVTASILCLALGLSLTQRRETSLERPPTGSGLEPPSVAIKAGSPNLEASVQTLTTSEPGSKRVALKPVPEREPSSVDFWDWPVVFIQKTNDRKIHTEKCSRLKKIAESRILAVGTAREAVANGYSPCKDCLRLVSLELDKHPAP